MSRNIALLLLPLLLSCCSHKSVSIEDNCNFNWNVFDSIKYNQEPISDLISDSIPVILYISTNECAECIYRLTLFNQKIKEISNEVQCIYIISGWDYHSFNYYLKENNIHFSDNTLLVTDSVDYFHTLMPAYKTNEIFLRKENSMIRLLFNPTDGQKQFETFKKLIHVSKR